MITTSLFFPGIITRTKSILSGRKGPAILQPLKDIWRLFRKGTVYSETSSFIFRLAPSIYFATVIMASVTVPFGNLPGILSFRGDFVFFAYTLAVGKFFMIIAAMDTGSSFEGMGASREALYSMLADPAFFILMGSFALLTGNNSFVEIFTHLHFGSYISYALGALATFVLVLLTMVENSRMPIDDPKTHLELTMIHEVMVLDNSGFDLGLILHAANLKFALYGALIANFLIPPEMPLHYSIPIFIGIQLCFSIGIGIIESFTARFRMSHNAQFIFTLTSISLLIFLGVLLMLGRIT
ncbi:MAG TPA: NADH-quinone oxidoreductase subunit H [Cyclobacteriaceae bacterium]|nr:NADH-quinone oxidoreductase subunit H [Cyclobacteriaceae bacterium]